MSRFRFELDPVIEARRGVERTHQLEVAQIEQERVRLEDRLRERQRLITSGKDGQRELLDGAIDVDFLRGHAATVLRSMRDAQRLAVELAGVYRRLEHARAALAEAARDRRAVELLRERRYEAWKVEQRRRETADMDEVAARTVRTGGAGGVGAARRRHEETSP